MFASILDAPDPAIAAVVRFPAIESDKPLLGYGAAVMASVGHRPANPRAPPLAG